jgi:hypothetical protein
MKYLAIMIMFVLLELVLSFFFIAGILTGKKDNLFLGTILGAEFLLLALTIIFYILVFLPPRKVVEERGEGLLW